MTERWHLTHRPKKFSEVLGQEATVRFCKQVLYRFYKGEAQMPVGFLFGGRSGVGKTTLARIVGASLNCEHRDGVEPCGECSSCVSIIAGGGDIIEIDASFFGLVDNIRALRERLQTYALINHRVIILDEAHMMSKEAFNVLLKLLESPPEETLFILCTTEAHKILETVRSRLVEFRFKAIPYQTISVFLRSLLKEEGIKCDEKVYTRLYRLSNDNLRDVIVSLEQLARTGDGSITEELVVAVFGDIFVFEKIILALRAGDYGSAMELYSEYNQFYLDFNHFLSRFLLIAGDAFVRTIKENSSDSVFYGKLFSSVYKFLQESLHLQSEATAKLFFHVLATEVGDSKSSFAKSYSRYVSEEDALSILQVDKP